MNSTKGVTQEKEQAADAVLVNSHLVESHPILLTSSEVSAGQALLKWSHGHLSLQRVLSVQHQWGPKNLLQL